jgi:hypothetical protein
MDQWVGKPGDRRGLRWVNGINGINRAWGVQDTDDRPNKSTQQNVDET